MVVEAPQLLGRVALNGLIMVSCIWRRRGSIVPTKSYTWRVGGHEALLEVCQGMSKCIRGDCWCQGNDRFFRTRWHVNDECRRFRFMFADHASCRLATCLKLATTGNKQLNSLLERHVPCL
jgi:hypothetical protein